MNTHVEGSGTGTGLARRKPMMSASAEEPDMNLLEDDKENARPLQEPSRRPRDKPGAPLRSFH
jgi:hypothetical protein